MDYEVVATERHIIFNTNSAFKNEVNRLEDYIHRINCLDNMRLEYMYIYSMQLTVDEATARIENVGVVANNKNHYRLEDGYRNVITRIWDNDSDIISLLGKAEEANAISFDIDYRVFDPEFGRFGSQYWNETSTLDNQGCAEHKIIEHGLNINESLDMYSEDENGVHKLVMGDFVSDASECEDVESWYCQDFLLDMYAENDWDNYPEIRDEIMTLLNDFATKYDPINEPADPFEDQIYIGDCPTVKSGELHEFIETLERIMDLAGHANAAIGLEATFKSNSGYPFAAMELELEENFKIATKYYRA